MFPSPTQRPDPQTQPQQPQQQQQAQPRREQQPGGDEWRALQVTVCSTPPPPRDNDTTCRHTGPHSTLSHSRSPTSPSLPPPPHNSHNPHKPPGSRRRALRKTHGESSWRESGRGRTRSSGKKGSTNR
jgi:hypothetical protein